MELLHKLFVFAILKEIACQDLPPFASREQSPIVGSSRDDRSNYFSSSKTLVSYQAQNEQGYYKFGYGAADGQYRVEEGSPLDGVLGSYGYIDTHGKEVKVYYKADQNGYQILTADIYRQLRSTKNREAIAETPKNEGNFNYNQKPFNNNPKPLIENPKPLIDNPKPLIETPKPLNDNPKPINVNPRPFEREYKPNPASSPPSLPNRANEFHSDPSGGYYDYSDTNDDRPNVNQEFGTDNIYSLKPDNGGADNLHQFAGGAPYEEDFASERYPLYRTLEALQPFPVYYFPSLQQYANLHHSDYPAPYMYPIRARRIQQTKLVIRS